MKNKFKKRVGTTLLRRGVEFRVWAPFAESVEVSIVVGNSFDPRLNVLMQSEGDGYWSVIVPEAHEGQEYNYILVNGDQRLQKNDPRALAVTTSSGNSVIVGNTYQWQHNDYVPPPQEQIVVYELHVGTFYRSDLSVSGSFRDVMAKLDHLADLGVNMIELMPITTMSHDRGWGYDPDYLFAIESLYGGREQFMELVDACHGKGIGVIVDVVFNHFGAGETCNLWRFDGWNENDLGGIYFYNDERATTLWGQTRPDYGRPEVRQFILDSCRMWVNDYRVDGIRVDSTLFVRNYKGHSLTFDGDLPDGWTMLQDYTQLVKKINPRALVIGEDAGNTPEITEPVARGGAGFDAQWAVTFPYALRTALQHDNVDLIDLSLLCREFTTHTSTQRILYVDSHDSAANGSTRFNDAISGGKGAGVFARERMLIAATLMCTMPGIPMIFQGFEFVQRGPFIEWEALDWSKLPKRTGIYHAVKDLIALRKNCYAHSLGLTSEQCDLFHVDHDNKVIAYRRWKEGGPKDEVVVVINFAKRHHQNYSLNFTRDGEWIVRFCSSWKGYSADFSGIEVPNVDVEKGAGAMVLPPSSAVILSQDQ